MATHRPGSTSTDQFYASVESKTSQMPGKKPTVPPPSQETPFHNRLSSRVPQTSTNVYQEPAFVEAAFEMEGKFWGPVSVDQFLEEFLDVEAPPLPEVDYESLADVVRFRMEPEMYDPLIAALKPFCKGIKLVNTSAVSDPDSDIFFGHCVKPDIGIYAEKDAPKPGECITQAKLVTGFGELKDDPSDEPFTLDQPLYSIDEKQPFERDTMAAHDTRGQLTVYANAIQATQFRTHSFSFFINKTSCRLIHWSRSCAIVTEPFNYTETKWLPMFFWHLSHANKSIRGTDTTFRRVRGGDEAENARVALQLKDTDPLYRVSVKDEVTDQTTFYIVHQPFTNNHIFPLGRGTRCFEAYDCQTKALVLLKDTWRVSKYEAEGRIYRELHEKHVSNIAEFITAGDVGHECGDVQKFSSAPKDKLLLVHIHYRLVLGTLGKPLTKFKSTWQMVNAVKCALLAHQEAVMKANILHRDVSLGNILMVGDDGGILIDWELCKRIGQGPATASCDKKTGTYQFISARLLMGTTQEHKTGDDLESFVHVLTTVAIQYAQNGMIPADRAYLLKVYDYIDGGSGGFGKKRLLGASTATVISLALEEEPFSEVLQNIYSGFGHRYGSADQTTLRKKDEEAAEAAREKLETHEWLYEVLEKAINNKDWKDAGDGRVIQKVSEENAHLTAARRKRKSMLPEYDEERDEKRSKRH